MPPLLLDDEEALAIAVGLRAATAAPITGIADSSLRALAKLEQVLPDRLRRRITLLAQGAVPPTIHDGPTADPETLAAVATACRAGEKIRFGYRIGNGTQTRRLVEPKQLVASGRRWYLVAWDEGRADWRTFRLDRIHAPAPIGVRVPPRPLPDGAADAAQWVARSVTGPATTHADVLLHCPEDRAREIMPTGEGPVTPVDAHTSRLTVGPDSPRYLALRVVRVPVPYTLLGPPEVSRELRALAERALTATTPPPERAAPTV
ncbi:MULTISPECIES: helix-turn-helix transcriptional regulator [Kitasatospora]|uniref:WYL domain-containing protein n=1 Tax=Kitasatospora cystarginea TaxID=58350 RepID=A0ABP5RV94_9ACTN